MFRLRPVLLLGLLAIVVAAITPGVHPAGAEPAATTDAEAAEPVDLTVMTFNIWAGGTQVDFDQVSAAIEAAGADIVGIQEPSGNLSRLARDLGWDHVYEPQQIISRYPLVVPEGAYDYVYAEVTPGKVVAVSNVHLRPYPYGPYDLRDGVTLDEVLANEQYHMDELASRFGSLPRLVDAGVPVFLTGDFNVASHLDWTAATAAATPRPFDREVRWPVSSHLEGLGFRDTFREVHTDPIAKPGYTWTPGYPPPSMTGDEVHDRIDFVYAAGPSSTVDSWVAGEPAPGSPLPGDFGGPHADIVVDPWPSDHRAVASRFRVTPADPPADEPVPRSTVSTSKPCYRRGEPVVVELSDAPGNQLDWLGIYDANEVPDGSPASYRWTYIDGEMSGSRVLDGSASGTTWPLPPGRYAVHLFANDGYQILATAHFTVKRTRAAC